MPPTVPMTSPAVDLRRAIDADPDATHPAPDFSPDGGVTVFDDGGHWARLQPLGCRVRISLADHDRLVAEAEVDGHVLIAGLAAVRGHYRAVAGVVEQENGLWASSSPVATSGSDLGHIGGV